MDDVMKLIGALKPHMRVEENEGKHNVYLGSRRVCVCDNAEDARAVSDAFVMACEFAAMTLAAKLRMAD